MLDILEQFRFSSLLQLADNTFSPNATMFLASLHLTEQAMLGHDRFLKSVSLWHPLTCDMFYIFIWYYHQLRVNKECGTLSTYELDILNYLETNLPPKDIKIPGTLVPALLNITSFATPYEWFGDVVPRLPAFSIPNNLPSQERSYIPAGSNFDYVNCPTILPYVDVIHRFAKGALARFTPTNLNGNNTHRVQPADHFGITANMPTVVPGELYKHVGTEVPRTIGFLKAIFTDRSSDNSDSQVPYVQVGNGTASKWYFNTPIAKTAPPESQRVNSALYSHISQALNLVTVTTVSGATNHTTNDVQINGLNQYAFDLPARPENGAATSALLLEHFLGLVDVPEAATRSNRIHMWPGQLLHDMNTFASYIRDSRKMSDLPLRGIGAPAVSWTLRNEAGSQGFFLADPIPAHRSNENHQARLNENGVRSFNITGETSDPGLDVAAERISALGAVRVNPSQFGGTARNAYAANHNGPWWTERIIARSSEVDAAQAVNTGIASMILPTSAL
nr:capsid protein [Rhizoctonia solani partitivirus 10]